MKLHRETWIQYAREYWGSRFTFFGQPVRYQRARCAVLMHGWICREEDLVLCARRVLAEMEPSRGYRITRGVVVKEEKDDF